MGLEATTRSTAAGFVFGFVPDPVLFAAANLFLLARDSLIDDEVDADEVEGTLESKEGRGGSSEVVKTSSSL